MKMARAGGRRCSPISPGAATTTGAFSVAKRIAEMMPALARRSQGDRGRGRRCRRRASLCSGSLRDLEGAALAVLVEHVEQDDLLRCTRGRSRHHRPPVIVPETCVRCPTSCASSRVDEVIAAHEGRAAQTARAEPPAPICGAGVHRDDDAERCPRRRWRRPGPRRRARRCSSPMNPCRFVQPLTSPSRLVVPDDAARAVVGHVLTGAASSRAASWTVCAVDRPPALSATDDHLPARTAADAVAVAEGDGQHQRSESVTSVRH